MYFTHSVLPEVKNRINNKLCDNCLCHGFPCLNCACYMYNGKMGPGYIHGKRVLVPYEDDQTMMNIANYLFDRPYIDCIIELYF